MFVKADVKNHDIVKNIIKKDQIWIYRLEKEENRSWTSKRTEKFLWL